MGTAKRKLVLYFLVMVLVLGLACGCSTALAQQKDPDTAESEEEATPAPEPGDPATGESEKSETIDIEEMEVPAVSKPDMRDERGLVSLDFTNTEISEIIKTMSEMTGRNFMVDKSVSGQVTIISPTKVTPREAYDIFLSVLAVNGFTTVDVGKITKIISRKDAKQNPIPTVTGGAPRPTDEIITMLIPLTNIDCNDVANSFRNLIGPDGDLFAYGPSNMVIISDAASNVNRLYRIIQQLDTAGSEQQIAVMPIEYASAETIAEMIEQLYEESVRKSVMQSAARRFSQGPSSRSRRQSRVGNLRSGASSSSSSSNNIPTQTMPNIIADTRTNSLVVKSSSFGIKRVREIVAQLDQPIPGGEGKIHVIYLENADSEELAATLAELAGGGGASGRSSTGSRATSRMGGSNLAGGLGSQAGRLSGALGSRFGAGGTGATTGSSLGRGGIAATTGRLMADFDGAVRITADPPTNSLVIVANNRDFKIIQEVIDKLDIPRRQVFVEAVIMEITMERGLDLGFEFRSTNDPADDGIQVIGGTNYGGIQNASANPLGLSGFAIGAVDGTISFQGQEFPNIGALFRAMQTDRDINVLSTPNLLTMDNEEAEIVVADNIPFVTGQIFSANNNNPTTTIERKDVGITLRMTPQINESDYVRLEIFQESSQVTDSPEGLTAAQVGVTTSKRTAQTLVVVKDRQTVIIGGLMKDNVSHVETKIPVLGDIPILGYLFKTSRKTMEKTNLLIFLTPYVVKDASDLEEITRISNERMRLFREESHTPIRSNLEDHVLREQHMAPSQNVFQTPRLDTIETDPRLRREMDGESPQTVAPFEEFPEEASPPGTGQIPPEEEEPFEDFTDESSE